MLLSNSLAHVFATIPAFWVYHLQTQCVQKVDACMYAFATKQINNVQYFITFGTLLGGIRQSHIIPWTDDIDFCILNLGDPKVQHVFTSAVCNSLIVYFRLLFLFSWRRLFILCHLYGAVNNNFREFLHCFFACILIGLHKKFVISREITLNFFAINRYPISARILMHVLRRARIVSRRFRRVFMWSWIHMCSTWIPRRCSEWSGFHITSVYGMWSPLQTALCYISVLCSRIWCKICGFPLSCIAIVLLFERCVCFKHHPTHFFRFLETATAVLILPAIKPCLCTPHLRPWRRQSVHHSRVSRNVMFRTRPVVADDLIWQITEALHWPMQLLVILHGV